MCSFSPFLTSNPHFGTFNLLLISLSTLTLNLSPRTYGSFLQCLDMLFISSITADTVLAYFEVLSIYLWSSLSPLAPAFEWLCFWLTICLLVPKHGFADLL